MQLGFTRQCRTTSLDLKANKSNAFTCRAATHDDLLSSIPNHNSYVLRSTKVVLVSPKIPENIGAALRAAANFEAAQVCVVDPRCDPFSDIVATVACESPLLGSLQVVPSLRDALAESQVSIGFTRRAGGGRVTHASLRALLDQFPDTRLPLLGIGPPLGSSDGNLFEGPPTAALVFGREESGLLDPEVLLCSHACAINTGRAFPSLNLSHAVAVVLAQLFDIATARGERTEDIDESRVSYQRERASIPANHAEIDALLLRASALLSAAGINTEMSSGGGDKGSHGRRRKPLGHLRHVLTRSQANTAEVRAMHKLLKDIEALGNNDGAER